MPEIVEVQIQVDGLQKIVGQTIKEVILQNDAHTVIQNDTVEEYKSRLENTEIYEIFRLGKSIIFALRTDKEDNPIFLSTHLAFTGGFLYNIEDKYEKIRFILSDGSFLIYKDLRKYGGSKVLTAKEIIPRYKKKFGADVLTSNRFEIEAFLVTGGLRYNKSIKEMLLDQKILSGLGNIYVCEVLFKAGISPFKKASDIEITSYMELADIIKDTIQEAYHDGGSSIRDYTDIFGNKGEYQNKHQVYGRENSYCPRCGTEHRIRRGAIGGRGTFFCSNCQK